MQTDQERILELESTVEVLKQNNMLMRLTLSTIRAIAFVLAKGKGSPHDIIKLIDEIRDECLI